MTAGDARARRAHAGSDGGGIASGSGAAARGRGGGTTGVRGGTAGGQSQQRGPPSGGGSAETERLRQLVLSEVLDASTSVKWEDIAGVVNCQLVYV